MQLLFYHRMNAGVRILLDQIQGSGKNLPDITGVNQTYEMTFQSITKINSESYSSSILQYIVAQLAKPNEKFMVLSPRRRRARDFEEAIEWLVSAGMLNRAYNVSKMEHPLSSFDKLDQFKLFVFDTGLLKHMAGIDNSAILLKSSYQFKGALTENYIYSSCRDNLKSLSVLL